MEENENFVTEEVTEKVEQTTEETPKLFTQDEVNEIVGKSKARTRAKIEKEYQRKYGELEDVLKAGTGQERVEDVTESLRGFYQQRGVQIPQKPAYSPQDIEVLARAEADDIISAGYDEVVEEVDRLTRVGVDNMTAREKAVFRTLAEHRQSTERGRELASLGVTEDVYNSAEFKDFAKKFDPRTPITDVYDIYRKTQPQKEIKSMGSMKSTTVADTGVKEYYSPEEARSFSKADFDKNPALFDAVVKSMQKWK